MNDKKLSKHEFYMLSFTWGLILTAVGLVVAMIMMITGHKPQRFGWCIYFETGENWGGCEFGIVFLKCRRSGRHLCEHEFGHAIQNCMFGPLMPLIVNLPSTLRYWYRRIAARCGVKLKTKYDDIWFEGQASRLGRKYSAEW